MRCWLFIFTMSMELINYVLGLPTDKAVQKSEAFGYNLNLNEDYTSGERAKVPIQLAGVKKKLTRPVVVALGYNLKLHEDYTSGEEVPKRLAGISKQFNRPLVVGDTFTPNEMLPIAEKLFKKVEDPGNGKGFVSSTKGPKELADKLFEAFFLSTKRIVTLKAYDIIGIDALQALALEGEDADNGLQDEVTEAAQKLYLRGQIVDIEKTKPLRSHYKLVTKVVPLGMKIKATKGKSRGIPLAKKLPPKRHLIVNKLLKLRKRLLRKNNKKVTQHIENVSPSVMKTTKGDKKKANCHWKYVCTAPGNLDTCHVKATCGNSTALVTTVEKQNHEKDELLSQFRRMVGITIVDEEVEKILEVRNLKLRPVNLEAVEKVESLAEFFNNIIVRENMESTTAMQEHFLTAPIEPLSPDPLENQRY